MARKATSRRPLQIERIHVNLEYCFTVETKNEELIIYQENDGWGWCRPPDSESKKFLPLQDNHGPGENCGV
jgi:hypothetical protein